MLLLQIKGYGDQTNLCMSAELHAHPHPLPPAARQNIPAEATARKILVPEAQVAHGCLHIPSYPR